MMNISHKNQYTIELNTSMDIRVFRIGNGRKHTRANIVFLPMLILKVLKNNIDTVTVNNTKNKALGIP
jgi:hypothetical protein